LCAAKISLSPKSISLTGSLPIQLDEMSPPQSPLGTKDLPPPIPQQQFSNQDILFLPKMSDIVELQQDGKNAPPPLPPKTYKDGTKVPPRPPKTNKKEGLLLPAPSKQNQEDATVPPLSPKAKQSDAVLPPHSSKTSEEDTTLVPCSSKTNWEHTTLSAQ